MSFAKTRVAGRVLIVEMSHVRAQNRLSAAASEELRSVFEDFLAAPALDVAVLTGELGVFCCGRASAEERSEEEPMLAWLDGLTVRLEPRKPVIGAVNGMAIDEGFELALACDLVVASDRALFTIDRMLNEPANAERVLRRLSRFVPPRKAFAAIALGMPLFAPEALFLGFVNELAAPHEVLGRAVQWADNISRFDAAAVLATMRAVDCSQQ